MSIHGFGDLDLKLLDCLAILLKLFSQELNGHRRRDNQRVIMRQQLGRTNSLNDLILLLLVSGGMITDDAANKPRIGATKLARIGLSSQHTKQQR